MIELLCEGRDPLKLREKDHRGGNYVSRARFLPGGGELTSPVARDLLRVGEAAFLADRSFRRDLDLGKRTRRLTVILPVEEPERWEAVEKQVVRFAEFASQDVWRFEFRPLKRASKRKVKPLDLFPPDANASVSLFSNGLDSLCGAAAALRRGETPVFVSHSPPGVEYVQRKVEALQNALGFASVQPLFFNVYFRADDRDAQGRRNMFPERTRRTRPVLFLSMAGAAALELGIPKIVLNENGVLAINLPVNTDQHGPQASRHAHPETLRRFEALLRSLWPFNSQPEVRNPFSHETKAEEIRHLDGAGALGAQTISCQYAGQQMAVLINWLKKGGKPHAAARECGLCFPCLIRRSAMEVAGVKEPEGHYVFDARVALHSPEAYAGAPLYQSVARLVRRLNEFSEKMAAIEPNEFVLDYLYELSLLPSSPEDIGLSARDAYSLHRRFADQIIRYINA